MKDDSLDFISVSSAVPLCKPFVLMLVSVLYLSGSWPFATILYRVRHGAKPDWLCQYWLYERSGKSSSYLVNYHSVGLQVVFRQITVMHRYDLKCEHYKITIYTQMKLHLGTRDMRWIMRTENNSRMIMYYTFSYFSLSRTKYTSISSRYRSPHQVRTVEWPTVEWYQQGEPPSVDKSILLSGRAAC